MINPNMSLDIGSRDIPLCERCGHQKICQYEGKYGELFDTLDRLKKGTMLDIFQIELRCKELLPRYTVRKKLEFCEGGAGYDFTETTDKSTP